MLRLSRGSELPLLYLLVGSLVGPARGSALKPIHLGHKEEHAVPCLHSFGLHEMLPNSVRGHHLSSCLFPITLTLIISF